MSKSLGRDLVLMDPDLKRWRSRLLPTAGCVVWMGAVGSDGYGRLVVRDQIGGRRVVTPHQVAAVVSGGQLSAGATVLHDCDLRLCCSTADGHVRVSTQSENMQQAAARGRATGPRPGLVDVRGNVGASRAIQTALRNAPDRTPEALAAVLAAAIAAGDPRAGLVPLW